MVAFEQKLNINPPTVSDKLNFWDITLSGYQLDWKKGDQQYNLIDCDMVPELEALLNSDSARVDGAILVVSAADPLVSDTSDQLKHANFHAIRSMIVFLNNVDRVSASGILDIERTIRERLTKKGFPSRTPIIRGNYFNERGLDSIARPSIEKLVNTVYAVF